MIMQYAPTNIYAMYVKECLPRKVSNGGIACNWCKGIVSNVGVYCVLYIMQFANSKKNMKLHLFEMLNIYSYFLKFDVQFRLNFNGKLG